MKYSKPLFFSVVAMTLLWSCSSFAQDEDKKRQARELYNQAIKSYERGEHKDAAAAFRKAYELRPSYKILFNLGQAEASSGRYGLAMEAFQQYLVLAKDEISEERKEYVFREISRIQQLIGELVVEAPEGSLVAVDGVERAETPLLKPILVVAGVEHEAVVFRENVEIFRKKFSVWGGKSIRLNAGPRTGPATDVAPESEPPAEEASDEIPPEESRGLDQTYFWTGLGGTGAFGILTIGLYVYAEQKLDDVRSDPGNMSLKDETDTIQKTGIAFMALTGVALVTTGILAAFTDWEIKTSDSEVSVSLSPWACGKEGGLGVLGAF